MAPFQQDLGMRPPPAVPQGLSPAPLLRTLNSRLCWPPYLLSWETLLGTVPTPLRTCGGAGLLPDPRPLLPRAPLTAPPTPSPCLVMPTTTRILHLRTPRAPRDMAPLPRPSSESLTTPLLSHREPPTHPSAQHLPGRADHGPPDFASIGAVPSHRTQDSQAVWMSQPPRPLPGAILLSVPKGPRRFHARRSLAGVGKVWPAPRGKGGFYVLDSFNQSQYFVTCNSPFRGHKVLSECSHAHL